MWDRIIAQFLGEAIQEARHIKDKTWKKLHRQYFREKKIHKMSSDNEGLKWIWYDRIGAMLSEIAKANGIPGALDQGAPMLGTYAAPVEVEDDGPDEDVPLAATISAANLSGIRPASTKRRRVSEDMCSALDRFVGSQVCIEKMKMETAIQLQQGNKKIELEILHLQQASTERVVAIFADVIRVAMTRAS